MEKTWIDTKAASEILNIHRGNLSKMITTGRLDGKPAETGSAWLVEEHDLKRVKEGLKTANRYLDLPVMWDPKPKLRQRAGNKGKGHGPYLGKASRWSNFSENEMLVLLRVLDRADVHAVPTDRFKRELESELTWRGL